MPDRILIVDDVATNRIVLKVKLSAASYDVVQAEDIEAGRAAVSMLRPRLVILSDHTGGAGAVEDFCRDLASDPATADIPVIVIGPDRGQAVRLAILAAGASDMLVQPLDEPALLAKVRSLLRRGPNEFTEAQRILPDLEQTERVGQDGPGRIAIVSRDRDTAFRLKATLTGRLRDRLDVLVPDGLFDMLRRQDAPDVFIVVADEGRLADLRLIAELRSRPESEKAAVVVIGGGAEPEFGIMALDLGAGDVLPSNVDADELVLRLRARLKQKRDGDRRQQRVEESLRMAVTDPLTGLLNRRATFARLHAIAADTAVAQGSYALMILDIDHFKLINDSYGHAAGDAVLAEVAGRLVASLRDDDLLGRIGGEEFLAALPDTQLVPARVAAERLRRVVEAEPVVLPSGEQVYVTLSIGVYLGGNANETVEAACDQADRALYAAKARGRNTVTVGRSGD